MNPINEMDVWTCVRVSGADGQSRPHLSYSGHHWPLCNWPTHTVQNLNAAACVSPLTAIITVAVVYIQDCLFQQPL